MGGGKRDSGEVQFACGERKEKVSGEVQFAYGRPKVESGTWHHYFHYPKIGPSKMVPLYMYVYACLGKG